jgi:hypothetical protein
MITGVNGKRLDAEKIDFQLMFSVIKGYLRMFGWYILRYMQRIGFTVKDNSSSEGFHRNTQGNIKMKT